MTSCRLAMQIINNMREILSFFNSTIGRTVVKCEARSEDNQRKDTSNFFFHNNFNYNNLPLILKDNYFCAML